MKKKNTDLKKKEMMINDMINVNIINHPKFDVGLISNGDFTFDHVSSFILIKGLEKEFKEYVNGVDDIGKYITATRVLKKTMQEDLPFDDLSEDYKKGNY